MVGKYMTVREVANTLRRTPPTILRWINEGKIFKDGDLSKVCDGYLIKETAIERILTENSSNLST